MQRRLVQHDYLDLYCLENSLILLTWSSFLWKKTSKIGNHVYQRNFFVTGPFPLRFRSLSQVLIVSHLLCILPPLVAVQTRPLGPRIVLRSHVLVRNNKIWITKNERWEDWVHMIKISVGHWRMISEYNRYRADNINPPLKVQKFQIFNPGFNISQNPGNLKSRF